MGAADSRSLLVIPAPAKTRISRPRFVGYVAASRAAIVA